MNYVAINEEIITMENAHVPLNDLGFLRGFAIFDFFRTSAGIPLFFDAHCERFFNSAKTFNLKHGLDTNTVKSLIDRLNAKNGFPETGFKLLLTGGNSVDGFTPSTPNFYIIPTPITLPTLPQYKRGVRVLLLDYVREFPSVKTTNYMAAVNHAAVCKEKEAMDVLYHHHGVVTEVSRSNFFIIKDGVLITTSNDILEGITREYLFKLIRHNPDIVELDIRPIKVEELKTADEAFLTSSTKRLMPVTSIGDDVVGCGMMGPITSKLIQLFIKTYEKGVYL